jgi:hypothetical protein
MKSQSIPTFPIDFVITWVDGSDKEWRLSKAAYTQSTIPPIVLEDGGEERYRSFDLLPYWFRGVEQCAPWVRRIYFVTQGQLPKWLRTDHPKLRVVTHKEFIRREYLPTFNSHTIEFNLHRLPDLAEHFVYFNDDMFLLQKIKPTVFFHKGLPRDMLALQPVVANPRNPVMSHIYLNNTLVLSKYFRKWDTIREHPGHYFKIGYPPLYFFYNMLESLYPLFTGFYTVHGSFPFLKQTFDTLWMQEGEILHHTCTHKLRSSQDVSPYLLREWQKLTGDFHPGNTARDTAYFNLSDENQKLCRCIETAASRMVCLNDNGDLHAIDKVKEELHRAFQKRFPVRSAFEKGIP